MKPAAGSVFIVDDDAGMRNALARLFRSAGHEAEAFASPREFLGRLPCAGAACLVLDISMPEMSGPELQDLMAEKGIALPIVFLTGHGDIPASVRAMKKGAADFLLKPVDGDVLLQVVDAALQRHAAGLARHDELQAIAGRAARLSAREREVMQHVIRGRINKQIAAELGISVKTVKAHRGRVMAAMGYRSLAELVRACQLAGLDAHGDRDRT
jgi:FixJ family two-component response regulator